MKKNFSEIQSQKVGKNTLGIPLLVVKTPKSLYKFLTNISMLNKSIHTYMPMCILNKSLKILS